MSPHALWATTLPLALFSWAGVVLFSAAVPPSLPAVIVLLLLCALAVTMTAALPIWLLAHALGIRGTGQRPVLALRAAGWVGLWAVICLALQLAGFLIWGAAIGLAVVLAMFEAFLLQPERTRTRK